MLVRLLKPTKIQLLATRTPIRMPVNSRRAAFVLATWFGCGYFPVASGSAGSIGALLTAWLLVSTCGIPAWTFVFAALLLLPPAVWSAEKVEESLGDSDPQIIVIDEVVGQWLALAPIVESNWRHWLCALILFRLFDITKPFGIRRLEKIGGGIGVVADDVAAGACAMIGLLAVRWFLL